MWESSHFFLIITTRFSKIGIGCIMLRTGFSHFFAKRKSPTFKNRTFIFVHFFKVDHFLFVKKKEREVYIGNYARHPGILPIRT